MTDTLDRRRSVTSGDFIEASPQTTGGGVWYFSVYDPGSLTSPAPDLPRRSVMTWTADQVLAATLDLEDMWAASINQAVTKIAVRGWEISDSDDSTRRTRKGQDLIMNFDGPAEYRSGMNKLVQDFLTTRNGCFMEVERESKSPASRPRALWHLDSLRCRRTGNLDYPVVYWDLSGSWHALRASDVIFFADMPSPRQNLYGIGRPAAERAFKTIVKLAAVETYFREKITGARALKLVFISGVTKKKLSDVAATADAEMERRGWTVYKGAVIVPTETDQAISVAEIDLAGVPDGFDVETERRDAYLRYANAIGVPVQDLQPLSGQGLGTGTQTVILDEAAEGRGITYFVKTIEDRINWLLMPKTTTFIIKSNDLRDRQAEANLKQTRTATLIQSLGNPNAPGFLTSDQALNIATDEGIVPKEFLPEDITPEGTVTDSGQQSKPAGEQDAGVIIPPLQLPVTKAADTDDLIDAELAAALDWAKKARDAGDSAADTQIPVTKAQTASDRAMFAKMGKGGGSGGGGGGAGNTGGLWPKGPDGRRVPPGGDTTPVKARTPEQTHAALMAGSTVKHLTPDQEQSLHFYQSQGHESVNNVLRGGHATERQRDDAERTTKNIDPVMRRSHLAENVEVHRGMLATDPAAHAALDRMQPGATLRERGYMSTSADPKVIERFGGGPGWDNPYPGDTPVTMRIQARAGTRALYMPAARPGSMANSERELLFDRNVTYRVTGRREINGRVELDLEILGNDD